VAYEPWDSELAQQVAAHFPDTPLTFEQYLGQHSIACPQERIPEVIRCLRTKFSFDFLIDITAVDYPERPMRFDLIYILYSFDRNERVRCRTQVNEDAPSLTSVFAGADWLEREVFDMFGIRFTGHPNLKRILLPEDWEGHPLRKEYPIAQPDAAWVAANLEML
jgi:NADH-quinone oxidoreductase subunit C